MNMRVLSNSELVAMVIGPKDARMLYTGRLTPLMVGTIRKPPHPKLQASLELARRLMKEELCRGQPLDSALDTASFFVSHFCGQEYESFAVVFLDAHCRIIRLEELFRGTVHSANIYPREVAKLAMQYNASACIFGHNHPSGNPEPSSGDVQITKQLKKVLELVDVTVLDHIVVGGAGVVVSMASRKMM